VLAEVLEKEHDRFSNIVSILLDFLLQKGEQSLHAGWFQMALLDYSILLAKSQWRSQFCFIVTTTKEYVSSKTLVREGRNATALHAYHERSD
jgi:hypothetical protein